MKFTKTLIVLVVLIGGVFAQHGEEITEYEIMEYYTHHDDPITSDPSSPEVSNPMLDKDEVDFFGTDAAVEMSAEMMVSSDLLFLNIPLKYKFKKIKNLTLSLNAPVIFKKKVKYTAYDATDGGLSDITMGASYYRKNLIKEHKGSASIKVNMPTGDHENVVKHTDEFDFENVYLVPLGTGAWGMTAGLGLNGQAFSGDFNLKASYKVNTFNESISESPGWSKTVTNVKRGDRILLNGSYRYTYKRVKITGVTQFVMIGDGEMKNKTTYTDGSPDFEAKNDMDNNITTIDLGLEGEFKIDKYFINKVFVKFRVPVMTNTGKGLDDLDRPIQFSFGVKKRI